MPQQATAQSQQPTDQPQQPVLQVVGGTTTQQPAADPFNIQRPPQPLSRPIASAQPYPLDALGPIIEQAASAIEELVQAPAAICAQSVLAACAYTAQQQIDVVMPTGSQKPVSVFFLSVGATGERKSAVDDHAILREYSSLLEALLAEPMPLEKGERNVLDPRPVRLDQDAAKAFKAFYTDIESEVAQGQRFAAISGLANKAPEHAARLAAVQTFITDPTAYAIGVDAFDRAVSLVRYYLDEALRLTAFAPLDHDVALAEMTRDWLINRGKALVHLADVYQFGPNAIRTKATAIKAMTVLEAHDWVIRLPGGTKVDGVARRDVWRLNLPNLPPC